MSGAGQPELSPEAYNMAPATPTNGAAAGHQALADDTALLAASASSNNNGTTPASSGKPKRVRTGCLTCRERHLKCDEALPHCLNCRKSARVCKRGIRLNFIDTQCRKPPTVPNPGEWTVGFVDESRDIASEYTGGVQRYPSSSHSRLPTYAPDKDEAAATFDFAQSVLAAAAAAAAAAPQSAVSNQPLPPIQGMLPVNMSDDTTASQHAQSAQQQLQHAQSSQQQLQRSQSDMYNQQQQNQQYNAALLNSVESTTSNHSPHHSSHHQPQYQHQQHNASMSNNYTDQTINPSTSSRSGDGQDETKEILNTQEETLYMQVFVEEVGLWMDSMDPMKHFSRLLPFHALGQPMLLNALLACGVRHLTLVNPAVYQEEKALLYYDKASRYLLRALENPERDSVICATTAVILNVYEIMTEKALPRMNHIAGARALIKECGWSARSTGIGAACFWINVGMELLSNLHFNWRASWHPDAWGLDLDFAQETEASREEVWTHRILYITAKVGDFRATANRPSQDSGGGAPEPRDRQQKRFQEWMHLKEMADAWNQNIPRTMHPLAYLYPYQTTSKSAFPEVWLIKRTTIVAKLFYHTAMCLLAQVNPIVPHESPEMHEMEQQHAHQICGIAAHVKDRGVASVALRSLAIAAECLTIRREQEEVLQIFAKIHKETGWRIGFIPKDLTEKWGWDFNPSPSLPTHANPLGHLNHSFSGGGSSGGGSGGAGSSGQTNTAASPGSETSSTTAAAATAAATAMQQYQFDQYGEMQQQRLEQQKRRYSQSSSTLHHQPPHYQSQNQNQTSPSSYLSPPAQASAQAQAQAQPYQKSSVAQQAQRPKYPQGIVNPLLKYSDFSNTQHHPYKENYVAPRHAYSQSEQYNNNNSSSASSSNLNFNSHNNSNSNSNSIASGGGLGLGFGGLGMYSLNYGQAPAHTQTHAHAQTHNSGQNQSRSRSRGQSQS